MLGILNNVANLAGFGAGNPVTTAVSFPTLTPLPPNYSVKITPSQACLVSVTNKTWNGFNVTLTLPSGVTLAAGTFDVMVIG